MIGSMSDDLRTSQVALVAAAKEASVKRFAPTEYLGGNTESFDALAAKSAAWGTCLTSGTEWARSTCGIFMNPLGTGTPKNEEEALGRLGPWTLVIDMVAGTADVSGDRDTRVSFTRPADIGRFVAAAALW